MFVIAIRPVADRPMPERAMVAARPEHDECILI